MVKVDGKDMWTFVNIYTSEVVGLVDGSRRDFKNVQKMFEVKFIDNLYYFFKIKCAELCERCAKQINV